MFYAGDPRSERYRDAIGVFALPEGEKAIRAAYAGLLAANTVVDASLSNVVYNEGGRDSAGEIATAWGNFTLVLKPKAGQTSSFSKLEIFIDAKVGGVTRIHYFDPSGKHSRTQVREGWQPFEGTQIPTKIRMKNLKTGDETVINLSEIDVKTPVSDDLFSRRTLMRG